MTPTPSGTLLLVDDEAAILSALRRTLRAEGHRIVVTTDPAEALGILEREAVDVVLSDVDMPSVSGVELMERVRHAFPDVVRILLTGRGSLDTAMRAINAGEVYRYLAKPWDDGELRDTVRSAFARREALRRAALADRASSRRASLLAELEREHPGITRLAAEGEPHVLDEPRLADLLDGLDAPVLRTYVLG